MSGTNGVRASPISATLREASAIVYHGDCRTFLAQVPDKSCQLIATSPPYNIGKNYERRMAIEDYLALQREVIDLCVAKLTPTGSICWQVGNHVAGPQEILPLDLALHPLFASHGLKLRNRIVWHFEHGLHCSKRFSGRYEVILWYTRGGGFVFNLDAVRVPQKYPGKRHFRGPKAGQFSCNPLGKNPGDVWVIPNVKHNHVEKTAHPCQFPIELVQRLILALTNEGDAVLDPFAGVGTTMAAAVLCGRRGWGCEINARYCRTADERIRQARAGALRFRPMDRRVYEPPQGSSLTRSPFENGAARARRRRHADPLDLFPMNRGERS